MVEGLTVAAVWKSQVREREWAGSQLHGRALQRQHAIPRTGLRGPAGTHLAGEATPDCCDLSEVLLHPAEKLPSHFPSAEPGSYTEDPLVP